MTTTSSPLSEGAVLSATLTALSEANQNVRDLTASRRAQAARRTEFANRAVAEGWSIKELEALLGLSRTGVVKVLAGAKGE